MGKKKDGPYRKSQWTSNLGRLTEKGNLKNGKLDGTFEVYYDNDKLHTRGNYKEGIPVSLWEYFYDSGLLKRKTHYNEDGVFDLLGENCEPLCVLEPGRLIVYRAGTNQHHHAFVGAVADIFDCVAGLGHHFSDLRRNRLRFNVTSGRIERLNTSDSNI